MTDAPAISDAPATPYASGTAATAAADALPTPLLALEPVSDLYLKTEKLLFFRLAFAAVGVFLSLGIGLFTRSDFDFDFHPVVSIIVVVILYVSASLAVLKLRWLHTDKKLTALNAVLIGSDVLSLTALVHFTRGVESDL